MPRTARRESERKSWRAEPVAHPPSIANGLPSRYVLKLSSVRFLLSGTLLPQGATVNRVGVSNTSENIGSLVREKTQGAFCGRIAPGTMQQRKAETRAF
jgi:hypothetical protein